MTLAAFELVSSSMGPPSSGASLGLHERSDEEIDGLPFGVICLGGDGLIRRYNLAESRFARIDRAQVLGQHFFDVVAPCTATPSFQGRVEAFLATDGDRTPERFEYVFHFRFGAQMVDVELVSGAAPDEIYICINRRKTGPLADDVPREQLAVAQTELAPDEEHKGVIRDESGRRILQLSPIVFEALAHAVDNTTYRSLCEDWGVAWGRLATVDIETASIDSYDCLLRELPMATAVDTLSQYISREGWGLLSVDFSPARQGLMVIHLERNAFAEAIGASPVPRCSLWSGFLRAVFSHLAGRKLVVGEISCCAQGHSRCTFAVAGKRRAELLDEAIEGAAGKLDAVIETMGKSSW